MDANRQATSPTLVEQVLIVGMGLLALTALGSGVALLLMWPVDGDALTRVLSFALGVWVVTTVLFLVGIRAPEPVKALLICVALIVFSIGFLAPFVHRSRGAARQDVAKDRLRELGAGHQRADELQHDRRGSIPVDELSPRTDGLPTDD